MLLVKDGFPVDDELVLCTVTSVQFHSVFVTLDEYGNKSGMIHISEVAPGRIRNIRDFVVENKKVVCKVLRVNLDKGHIDLSLRRVNESQKQLKLNEIKQEQFVESIISFFCKQKGLDIKIFFDDLASKLLVKYSSLFDAFSDVSKGVVHLEKFSVNKSISEEFSELIRQRIKPPEVVGEVDVELSCFSSDGVSDIKNLLLKQGADFFVSYSGGGKYKIVVKGEDHKRVDKLLDKFCDNLVVDGKANKVLIGVCRKDNK